jgi:putative ABC transport system ATP-binding protein
MDDLVDVQRAGRKYPLDHREVIALDDVSLRIQPGEFLAIAGPSGSGKSTLLNLIGCIDRPTSGRIFIDGRDITVLDRAALAALRRRELGFVFQSFNLIPVFTAFENVEYPLLLARTPERERRQRVSDALERVGLADRAQHRPDLLSGGERQRVAVARAIVHRPALVLADEPTANLDTCTAMQLIDLMRELNRGLGSTFVFSTHDPRLLDHAQRIVRLCDGKVTGDSREVEENHEQVSAVGL